MALRTKNKQTGVQIRWMIRRDLPTVLSIDQANFRAEWTEEDFIRCLRQRNCIGMVSEVNDQVVGYMIYELHSSRIHLLRFAVCSKMHRTKIGTAMVEKLISKLSSDRRNRILLEVPESNLVAQQFFRNRGFRAISVLQEYCGDTSEDAYLMQYRFV